MKNKFDVTIQSSHTQAAEHNDSTPMDSHVPQPKQVHPAMEYLRQLHHEAPSPKLKNILLSFATAKSIDSETFTAGVKKFIKLANRNLGDKASASNRKTVYGTNYSGLHYINDLVGLWNSKHPDDEPVLTSLLLTLAPSSWEYIVQNSALTLIYKGTQPAQALDQLVKGPTIIDCGMFAQLSLWFGIRHMLGNEHFNQCFGRTPFFITQNVYHIIAESSKPYAGNPLYSFLSPPKQTTMPTVAVKHIANSPKYLLKHPGESYAGENCIVIDKQYYIFDPILKDTEKLSETTILNLLRLKFNEEQTHYDNYRLSLYAEYLEEISPQFQKTYGQLVKTAHYLRNTTLTEDEMQQVPQYPFLELNFDLHKLTTWLHAMATAEQAPPIASPSTPIDYALIPVELLKVIPFENRTSMDFSKFKQATAQQKELLEMSKQFCQSVMREESKLIILSGKAGVGKTASAVCAAKELAARGKKVVWISEVMVKGWTEQAQRYADLDQCSQELDNLLATEVNAVFLDDDNLAGFSGNLLLEKIYAWYVQHPGKGLFITSNKPIGFENCYGHQLDGQYHYPPFCHYHAPQYLNWLHKTNLAGESLRAKREGQSIGAIVSDSVWKTKKKNIGTFELIPAFNEGKELAPIRRSLCNTGLKGDTYDALRPIQQQWLDVRWIADKDSWIGGRSINEKYLFLANPVIFTQSDYQTIILELSEEHCDFSGKEVNHNSIKQLIRVLNYAHDQGGRRIILLNKTSFSPEQLLIQIAKQLPSSERERTWSRLMLLLCETETSIFEYEQCNGPIKSTTPENALVMTSSQKSNQSSASGQEMERLFPKLMNKKSSPLLFSLKNKLVEKIVSEQLRKTIRFFQAPDQPKSNLKTTNDYLIAQRHVGTVSHKEEKTLDLS